MKISSKSLTLALALFSPWLAVPGALGDDAYTPQYTQGNTFRFTTANHSTVNTSYGAYIRFTATETTSATSLSLFLNSGTTASSLTYGLQAENESGNPDGTFLASGTVTPTANAWNTIIFGEQALVAGKTYYVVVQPTLNGEARVRRLVTDSVVLNQTYGIRDEQYKWGRLSGGTPGTPSSFDALSFVVGTTSSQGMGFAYYTSSSSILSSTTPHAQQFRFTTGAEPDHTTLDSITLRLSIGETDLRDVQVTLLNDANVTLATTVLASSALIRGASNDYTVTFDDNPVLTEGSYYKIALTITEPGSNSIRWFSYITGSSSDAINSATFQGLSGYALSYSNAAFTGDPTIDHSRDYFFSYTTVATIPEPGSTALLIVALAVTGVMIRRSRG